MALRCLHTHTNPGQPDCWETQARRLGAALSSRQPSAVFASSLHRAVQTAAPVAERSGPPVVVDERLGDRDYGPWTEVSKDDVVARWGSVDDGPSVEPASTVRARALAGLTDIPRRHGGGDKPRRGQLTGAVSAR